MQHFTSAHPISKTDYSTTVCHSSSLSLFTYWFAHLNIAGHGIPEPCAWVTVYLVKLFLPVTVPEPFWEDPFWENISKHTWKSWQKNKMSQFTLWLLRAPRITLSRVTIETDTADKVHDSKPVPISQTGLHQDGMAWKCRWGICRTLTGTSPWLNPTSEGTSDRDNMALHT